jgi:RecA/RadA recombinase
VVSSFDDIFKAVEKKTKEDPLSSQHKAGDLTISSHIPFSILTGVPELDYNIARPGWPAGRVIELFGYEHCNAYDAFIQYQARTPDGKIQNSKGGTIESLYHKFHGIPRAGKGKYLRPQTKGAVYYAPSVNEDDVVIQNKIVDVVKTGENECFAVTTKTGLTAKTTLGHKFFTGEEYVELSSLSVGDIVFVHNKTRCTIEEKKKQENRQSFYVDNHPYFSRHHGIRKYRIIYEAYINGVSIEDLLQRLNLNKLEGLSFVPKEMHIHHLDGDHTNNRVDNLCVVSGAEHRRHHALLNRKQLGFIAVSDEIVSIVPIGVQSTYDLKMETPYHNYIANGFVTHNCGKTTLAYHAIAEAQRMGGGGYFIDTEKSWDEKRAVQCGINPDLNFRIMDCDSIEAVFRSILSILDARLKSNDGKPFIIVVDSVTGTATEFMKKHEMGKEERIGQDARAIRGGMRRVMEKLAKAKVNLFMINHAIATCATFKFAKQSEAAGGHAIKLFSTVRVNLTHGGWITVGEKEKKRRVGQTIKMRVEKLKGSCMSQPDIKEVALYNTHGFDTLGSLLTAGCKTGWVTHSKGSQDYAISDLAGDEVIDFSKANWENVVNDRGGLHVAYREFISYCMENGMMEAWGG